MANGFFFGGVAKGIQTGMSLNLASDELKLKQKQIELQNQQFQLKNHQDAFNNWFKTAQDAMKSIKGNTREEINANKLKYIETIRPVAEFIGKGAYDTQFIDSSLSGLMGIQTNTESGLIKAEAEKQKLLSVEEANKQTAPAQLERKKAEALALSNIPAGTNKTFVVFNTKTNNEKPITLTTMSDGSTRILDQTGKQITLGPDEVLRNVPSTQAASLQGTNLQAASKTALEKTIQQSTEALASYKRILDSYDPKFLTHLEQLKVGALNEIEKWGKNLNPSQKLEVQKFTKLEQNTYSALNTVVHNLSGAATTVQEAERLKKQMPDMKNDGPTKFMEHAKNAYEDAQAIIDRAKYFREHGMSTDISKETIAPMSIDYFKQRRANIEKRGQELNAQGYSTSQIRDMLRSEFGL